MSKICLSKEVMNKIREELINSEIDAQINNAKSQLMNTVREEVKAYISSHEFKKLIRDDIVNYYSEADIADVMETCLTPREFNSFMRESLIGMFKIAENDVKKKNKKVK